MFHGDLSTFIFVVSGGAIPPLVWLWFWLREDGKRPEPRLLILATFFGGMVAVPIALGLEKILNDMVDLEGALAAGGGRLILTLGAFAAIEEIVKYLAAQGIAFPNKHFDEPIDAVIYMITAALGFAALENTLFLIQGISHIKILGTDFTFLDTGIPAATLISNNLRFIGANVLHVVSSGVIGVLIGLSFYRSLGYKLCYFLAGLIAAIGLHTLFNFFILKFEDTPSKVFLILWLAAIILILLFEKVKRVTKPEII